MKSNFCFMFEFLNKISSLYNFLKDNWKTLTAIFSLICSAITTLFIPILQTFGYFHTFCISFIIINFVVFSLCSLIWIFKIITTVIKINKQKALTKIEVDMVNQKQQNEGINNRNTNLQANFDNTFLDDNLTPEEKQAKLNEIIKLQNTYIRKEYENPKNYFYGERELSDEKMENFIYLFNRYMNSFVSEVVRQLLEKAMKQVDKISKDAVLFLIKLTEEDLSILKKQFKYVSHRGIFFYENIAEDMKTAGLFNAQYSMKFYNQIWCHEYNISGGRNLPVETPDPSIGVEFYKKNYVIIKAKNGTIEARLQYFTLLTDTGFEVYELLKDEIDDIPDEYVNKFLSYNKEKYPGLEFELKRNNPSS